MGDTVTSNVDTIMLAEKEIARLTAENKDLWGNLKTTNDALGLLIIKSDEEIENLKKELRAATKRMVDADIDFAKAKAVYAEERERLYGEADRWKASHAHQERNTLAFLDEGEELREKLSALRTIFGMNEAGNIIKLDGTNTWTAEIPLDVLAKLKEALKNDV